MINHREIFYEIIFSIHVIYDLLNILAGMHTNEIDVIISGSAGYRQSSAFSELIDVLVIKLSILGILLLINTY